MEMIYKNLTLRKATPADAAILCRWWNDGNLMRDVGFPHGLKTTEEKIIRQLDQATEDNRLLILEEDRIPVGELHYQNKGTKTASIGLKICELNRQNQGLGTLAAKMLITFLFNAGYEKIMLDVALSNARAQRVYEKIGFRRLDIRHNCWKDQLGILQSAVDYELLNLDFTPLEF